MAGTPRSVQPERHALRCAKLKSINRTMCRSSAPPQAVEEVRAIGATCTPSQPPCALHHDARPPGPSQPHTTTRTPQIVSWAQSQFEAEVMGRPDEAIRLTRLCMLVALEEEAAQRREGGFADVTTVSAFDFPPPPRPAPFLLHFSPLSSLTHVPWLAHNCSAE